MIRKDTVAADATMIGLQGGIRYIIHQGGTSSGKTFGTLVGLAYFLLSSKKSYVVSVVGQTIPHLRTGAQRDFDDILAVDKIRHTHNKTERTYHIGNSIVEFLSIDKLGKAKGGKRNILFINEANEIDYTIVKQLILRTSDTVIIDYNPTHHFWFHDKLLPGLKKSEYIFKRTTYKDNPSVSDAIIREIEKLRDEDEELWKVYGLGYTGNIKGVIFPKVVWIDEMPEFLTHEGYGMDFGFTNDPTTLCRAGIYQGAIYAEELIYDRGLSNDMIANMAFHKGYNSAFKVVADNEPKSIAKLDDLGLWIEAARKGPGSINFGISTLKSYPIYITNTSINWMKEQKRYKWKEKDGRTLNTPIDSYNHLWDALRYWADGHLSAESGELLMAGYSY